MVRKYETVQFKTETFFNGVRAEDVVVHVSYKELTINDIKQKKKI